MVTNPGDADAGARDDGREALLKETAAPAPKKKRRWLRRIAIGVPVFLALVVLMLPTILSTAPVRRRIEAAIGEAACRKVTIADHSIGWFSPVTVEGLVIYEKDGTTPFLKVGKTSVDLAFRPLLSKRVEIRSVEVSGVEARVVKRRDGTLSTDDLGKRPAGAPPAAQPPPSQPAAPQPQAPPPEPYRFRLGTVSVHDVTLRYIDEAGGGNVTVSNLVLNAKPGAAAEEILADLKTKVEVEGAAPGDLEATATLLRVDKGFLRPEFTGQVSVKFAGFDLAAIVQKMSPMKGVEFATGAVSGTLNVRLPAGGDQEFTLETVLPAVRWADAGKPPAVLSQVWIQQVVTYHPREHRIEIKPGGRLRFEGAELQVNGTVDMPADAKDTDNPVDLLVRFDGEMSHFKDIFPAYMAGQDTVGPLRSFWNIKGTNLDLLKIDGTAEVTSWTYTLHGDDGKDTWWKVPHPGMFKIESHGTLDLRRRDELAKSRPDLPWSSLTGLNLDFQLNAPWLQSQDMDLKQVFGQFALREQKLDITKFSFILNGGKVGLTGGVLFDQEDAGWNLRTTTESPVAYSYEFSGIAALLNPGLYSTQKGQVETKMGWDISVTGRGFAMDLIAKTLKGEGTLKLEKGTLAGSPMLSELYKQLRLTGDAKYSFSLMEQKFRIDGGKIYNEFSNWQGTDKEANISISGETDFDGNMKQAITVSGDPSARWGKTTGAIVDVLNKAGGLPLGGTVSSPTIEIDYEKALKGAVGGILENPDLKEKGKGILDGIFGPKKKK